MPSVTMHKIVSATTIKGASLQTIAGAAHFMIATHAGDVARAVAGLVRAEGA
jgi:hypothetical protein